MGSESLANTISSDAGLVAIVLATANTALGVLLAVRYAPPSASSFAKIKILLVHNWTAYLLMVAMTMHPLMLLLVAKPKFSVASIAVPIFSPVQPVENTLGAIGFYLVLVVMISSLLRRRMAWRTWKALHLLSYIAAPLLFLHGIFAEPTLSNTRVDPFDGEKLLVEACLLFVLAVSLFGVRFKLRQRLSERPAPMAFRNRSGIDEAAHPNF